MLKIKNITKKFGKTAALDDFSLNLAPGSRVGLIGPNGSGKSTLFNLISGLVRPSAGSITFNDRPIEPFEGDKRIIGYAIQNFGQHMDHILRMELEYFARLAKLDNNEMNPVVIKFLDKSNLKEFANNKIKSLSFGNLQKINLFQAQLNEPAILLLDEPFVSLDFHQKMELKNQINKIKKTQSITIISSHNLNDILELCGHFIFINKGKLVRYISKEIMNSNFYTFTVPSNQMEPLIQNLNLKNINFRPIANGKKIINANGDQKIILELSNEKPELESLQSTLAEIGGKIKQGCSMEEIYQYFIQ